MNTRVKGSSSRLTGRLLVFVWAALLLGATGAKATPVKTLVQDTLYRADGSAAHGTVSLRWSGFSTSAGEAVAAGEMTVTTNASGGISLSLIPNTGSSPSGSYYKVVIKLDDGTTSEELWVVPATASTTVAAIRAKVVPQAVATQFVSRDYVDSALGTLTANPPVHLNGAESIGGTKTFLLSPQVPAPTDAGAAANKGYVDHANTSGNAATATALAAAPAQCIAGQYSTGVGTTGAANCSPVALPGGVASDGANGLAVSGAVATNDLVARSTPVFDVRGYGAKGDGITNDTAAINAAITACHSAGGGTVLMPATTAGYNLKRAVTGLQQGGIRLEAGCSLIGHNTKVLLTDNASFIYGNSSLASSILTNVAADVAVGGTNLTVVSSGGFSAGQEIYFRLVQNPTDLPEVQYFGWATITAIPDGTHVTLDRPMQQAMTYASTPAANRTIQAFPAGIIQDVEIKGFQLLQSAGGNSEEGIYLVFARNVKVSDITCMDPGAGCVIAQYSENLDISNVRVPHSTQQLSQSSKGRVIACAECSNVNFHNIQGSNFDGTFAFIESYSRGIRLDNILIVDNSSTRVASSFFSVVGNSEVSLRDVRVEGNGANLLDDGGSGMNPDIENLTINTGGGMIVSPAALGVVHGRLSLGNGFRLGNYGPYNLTRIKTWSGTFYPTVNSTNNFALPFGIYKSVRMFVSNATGVTSLYLTNAGHNTSNLKGYMSATGSGLVGDISAQSTGLSNATYPFNTWDVYGKTLTTYTDATLVAGTYITIELEYWPFLGSIHNDLSSQLIQASSPTTPLVAATASIGGAALAVGGCASGTATVTGAAGSMVARATPTTYPGDGFLWDSYVSAANTVTVKICAILAGTPLASTYNVRVIE